MKDIFPREERLGITRTSILSMIGQGLLFVISIGLIYIILLFISV